MTASDILRIATTVGVMQLLCNLVAFLLVFRKDNYQKALGAVQRTKSKLAKEKEAEAKAASKDKFAKRLKRAEDDYGNALASVTKLHFIPNLLTSVVFVMLLRILGTDLKGAVVGIIPFTPFKLMKRITSRGLEFPDDVVFESTNEYVTDVSQACSFMFIYVLSTFSIKFYVNQLFGTIPPQGSEGLLSFVESPQGKKIIKGFGLDPDAYKTE